MASTEIGGDLLKAVDVGGAIRVQKDPRNRYGLLLVCEFEWLHTPTMRAGAFEAIAQKLKHCNVTLAEQRILLNPTASGEGPSWRRCLSSDRHSVEVFNDAEQAHACNLLGMHAATIQSFTGRAAVSSQIVEGIHSKLGSESLYFAPVEWISTAPEHLVRMQRFLKEVDGVPRLERLEIFPAGDGTGLSVNSAIADGAAFLSTTRSVSIVHQAVVMRARRLAHDGTEMNLGWRTLAERNRARVVVDGPRALLEPKRALARERLLALLMDLRPELQALNVTFDELAPFVLGPMLRRMGLGGLCSENEYIAQLVRRCQSQRRDVLESLRREIVDRALDSPLTRANQQAYPKESAAIAEWWAEQLLPTPTHNAKGALTSEPVFSHERGERQRRPDLPQRRPAVDRVDTTTIAKRLTAVARADTKQVARELAKAVQGIDPRRFGILVGELPDEEKAAIRRVLAPGSGRIPAVPAGTAVWNHALASQAKQIALQGGIGILAIEESVDRSEQLRTRTAELFSTCPPDCELLTWKRFKTANSVRQELLLLRKVAES